MKWSIFSKWLAAFLSQLEYFTGIMLLTTNLMSNIDEALLSRVQIHLCYPALSVQYRSRLWENFITRLRSSTTQETQHPIINLSQKELELLSAWCLNGREIKNVVKTAHLWCSYNGLDLTKERFESAIMVTAPFAKKTTLDEDPSTSNKRPRIS